MNPLRFVLPAVLVLIILGVFPPVVMAGPNAGGVLLVHANTSLVYTTGTTSYCAQSGLEACSEAVTSVPWDPGTTTVFYVIAAFPDTAQPRLKGLSWGVEWDDAKLVIVDHGSCADFDVADGGWPASGKGIGQSFLDTRTGLLSELYWFAGYAYGDESDSTSFALIPHPLHGGQMVDDAVPAMVDSIAAYGRLGFGNEGHPVCPATQDPDSPPEPDGLETPLPNASEFVSVSIGPGQIDIGSDPYREVPIEDIRYPNAALRHALGAVGAVSLRRACPSATSEDLIGHDAEGRPFPLADLTQFYRIRFRNPEAAIHAVGSLRRLSLFGTPSVVPRFELPVSTVPNDSLFDQYETWIAADAQWFLRNDGLRGPDLHDWGCAHSQSTFDIRAEAAWSLLPTYGDSTVVIGLVDTGIRGGNSEQPAVLHRDLRVIPLTSSQRALIQQHPTVDWCIPHGTVMSGAAAAKTDNVSGVAGVCGQCSLLDIENAHCEIPWCEAHHDTCGALDGHWLEHAYAAAHLSLPYNAKLAAMLISGAGCSPQGNAFYPPDDVTTLWHLFAAHNIALVAPSGDYCWNRPWSCAPANIPFVFGVSGFTWDGRFWDGPTSCYGTALGSTVGWSEYPLRTASFTAVTGPASGTMVSTGPDSANSYRWTRGECSSAAAIVAGAVGFLQSLSKAQTGAETDVEDVLGLLRATAREYRTDPTSGATCPADSCPREVYGTGMIDVGAAAYMLMQKHVWHQIYFDEHTVTENSYGWQFDPVATFVDTSGVMDTTWVQYRASATVSLTPRSEDADGREIPHYLAWARKKSANSLAAYPKYMMDRVQLARSGVRDCYLYLIDTAGQARITGYTYAWRIGAGPLHFLIPEDQMRLTYCNVRGQIIGVDGPDGSRAVLFHVSPNPAQGHISLYLPGQRPRDLRLEVFDSGGRLVRSLPVDALQATGRVDWDCHGIDGHALPSGAYWIRAASGHRAVAERVVVIR